jgi:hypothetical protein
MSTTTNHYCIGPLRLEARVQAQGIDVHVPESRLDEYLADPYAFVARATGANVEELRAYIACSGEIRCMEMLRKGRRCRNQFGVHPSPGHIPLVDWLPLHRAGWYCRVHGG